MTLRRRLAEHLVGTSVIEHDEQVLRRGAGLVRELADDRRGHPERTLADVAPPGEALRHTFDEWRLNLVPNLAAAGLVELAVETAGLLLALDPDSDVDHAASMAVVLAETGRAADALRVATENVDAHPRDVDAWAGLVEVHRALGDREAAGAALQQAIEVADEYGEFGAVGDLLERFDDGSVDEQAR